MSEIQDARGVLAKWRKNATSPMPWSIYNDGRDNTTVDARGSDLVQLSSREVASWAALDDDDARLIVGTAGNPDLLDGIDDELRWGLEAPTAITVRIAAALIAADERMRS